MVEGKYRSGRPSGALVASPDAERSLVSLVLDCLGICLGPSRSAAAMLKLKQGEV